MKASTRFKTTLALGLLIATAGSAMVSSAYFTDRVSYTDTGILGAIQAELTTPVCSAKFPVATGKAVEIKSTGKISKDAAKPVAVRVTLETPSAASGYDFRLGVKGMGGKEVLGYLDSFETLLSEDKAEKEGRTISFLVSDSDVLDKIVKAGTKEKEYDVTFALYTVKVPDDADEVSRGGNIKLTVSMTAVQKIDTGQ